MTNKSSRPEEVASEAREVQRRRPPKSSRECFTEPVRKGWINACGQVAKLLSGTAEPEPNYERWIEENDVSGRENGPLGHERVAVVAANDQGATG